MDLGSFARKTKKRPLDDVDLIHCLHAEGAVYRESVGGRVEVVPGQTGRLRALCHESTGLLNSKKVINKFVAALNDVPQYEASPKHRRGEAAVLRLKTHPWDFDIVPAFFTTQGADGRDYFIIPDGDGHWKKTDPRIDRDRVTSVNQGHCGIVLGVIRLAKYWNCRPTMPSMSSYLLETMVVDLYEQPGKTSSEFIDMEFARVLEHVQRCVWWGAQDPKRIEGDINDLSFDERSKISTRAGADLTKAHEAMNFERAGDHKTAISKWGEILGPEFPVYAA